MHWTNLQLNVYCWQCEEAFSISWMTFMKCKSHTRDGNGTDSLCLPVLLTVKLTTKFCRCFLLFSVGLPSNLRIHSNHSIVKTHLRTWGLNEWSGGGTSVRRMSCLLRYKWVSTVPYECTELHWAHRQSRWRGQTWRCVYLDSMIMLIRNMYQSNWLSSV